ncbi:MAG: ABC transporter ATP-binding protein [Syntrophobacterales bacterium]
MILLRDIRYRYPRTNWILKGVDLSVDDGEYVFVAGANGSGKSTLGYLFNGLVPHFFGGTLEGSASINHADIRDKSVAELFSHVGLVLQNPDAQLFNSTVEDEIAFGLESLGLSGGEINNRIREISRTLNIEDLLGRSPETLSGGEKRLAAIASVLCLDPPVLLMDEPFGDLDWQAAKGLRQTLLEINRSGKTLVVIEQRVDRSLQDATRCLILDAGSLLHDGPTETAKEVLIKEHLIPNYPNRSQNGPAGTDPILTVRDLSHLIQGKEILKSVSLEVRAGETVAIIGRNGSGKTTLIKHFNGLLRPTEGKVVFQGEEIRGKAPSEMAADMGLSFQNPNNQFFKYRVKDEILVGPKIVGKLQEAWLEELWNGFNLRGLLEKSPYRLSEGEKRRVAIASILAMRPKLLILDEPTSGQDGRSREALALLLSTLKDRGLTTLIATHDLNFARAMADRWIILHEGRVVQDGSPQDLCNDEQLIRLGALPDLESDAA